MKNSKAEKKGKTFNRQPERFQWNDTMDKEYIFPEEYEMIEGLRSHFGERVDYLSDKFLMYFLLSRRTQVESSKEVIAAYLNVVEQNGWKGKRLTMEDAKTLRSGFIEFHTGLYDNHGRSVIYMYFERNRPKESSIKDLWAFLVYEIQYTVENTPLCYLRNGSIHVVNMSNAGMKNMDPSKSKELSKAFSGVMPKRIRRSIAVDGGSFLKVLWRIAKLVLPKKMVKRFEVGNHEMLKDLIPSPALPEKYGGECKLGAEDFIRQCEEYDKKFASTPLNGTKKETRLD